jgi:prepilin-type processing-associated H-X9-DG protein
MRWARSTYGMNNVWQYTAPGTTQRQSFSSSWNKIQNVYRPDARALLGDRYPWDCYFTGSGDAAAQHQLNFPHANTCSLLFVDGHVDVLGRGSWQYDNANVWYAGVSTRPGKGCYPYTAPCP